LTKTIPKVYVTRFFQLVTMRQFAEAERVLERLKQKIQMSERNRGYFQALYGMLLAQRNNDDRYAFLSNLNIKDKKELKTYRREFLRQSEYRLNADYDRGFFSAWADYMRILPKLELTAVSMPNKNRVEKEAEVTETQPEIEAEESKEAKDEERGEAERETKMEAKKVETEVVEETESTEKIEPRQSTLFDFSK
jgi:ATP/maltotriose-dependent transcriptional regulator MalT